MTATYNLPYESKMSRWLRMIEFISQPMKCPHSYFYSATPKLECDRKIIA
ncbi:MAG: hypothetical protein RMZ41_013245 [Nostoc sp. DedVER02]|nr:hypothetical protein [Nostoc sp. DedVER02]MDZ8113168.1 hypothetical protein [Nostoc sp. DedVER01b]